MPLDGYVRLGTKYNSLLVLTCHKIMLKIKIYEIRYE
jgi:hypothetical protein